MMAYLDHPMRSRTDAPVYHSGDGSVLYLYRNATAAEYTAYLARLMGVGYTCLQEHGHYNQRFCALEKEGERISVLFIPSQGTARVVTEDRPTGIPLAPTDCDGRGETAFYGFENDHTLIDCGMCLAVQCPDHSFFLVDSGHYLQMNDNDRLHQFLRQRTPAGEKIVINGWLVTHTHTDHISKLSDFLKYNCDDVVIQGIYGNFLPDDYGYDAWDREEQAADARFKQQLARLTRIPKHKLHTGQRIYIRNLTVDVLCTQEDIYPDRIVDFNDSSAVVMLTAENTRIFIPGDASALCSRVLEARYAGQLKCDIVQISHHGHFGLSEQVYEELAADVAVFPVTRIKFEEELPRQAANRRAIALAGAYYITSDGTVKIPLPYNRETITVFPDETVEDFRKVERLWGYTYPEEYRRELYALYLKNGGRPQENLLPVDHNGTFLD